MIRLENVTFGYQGDHPDSLVFSGLNLKIGKGQWVALTGGSGSGKSTLLKLIKGFIDPISGGILINGKARQRNTFAPEVAYVGPNPENQIIGSVVEDEVLFGLQFVSGDEMRAGLDVDILLRELGLLPLKYYFTPRLSGGEQQRLLIASHLALKPSVIMLDNSLAMVDAEGKGKCLQLLKMFQTSFDVTIILVDHQPDVISWADRVIHLNNGRVLFS